VRSAKVGTVTASSVSVIPSFSASLDSSTGITWLSSWSAEGSNCFLASSGPYEIQIVNSAARAASRMKSPTSVESDHWKAWPPEDMLRNETDGVAGARDARISLLTCDSGCEGCRRITVGGV